MESSREGGRIPRGCVPALLVGVLVGVTVLLAACRGDAPDASPPTDAVAAPSAPSAPAGEPAAALPSDLTPPAAPPVSSGAPPIPEPPADEPPLDELEPADPWEGRRRDLLIALTDPVDTELIRAIGETVAARRALPLRAEVPVYLIRRADLADYFLELFDETDLAGVALAQHTFRLLGIIPRDVDLLDLRQDLYVGLVLGFYDSKVEAFVIVSDNDHIADRNLATITHEFVHALQDQHFDVDALFETRHGNADASLALRFLLEGDARSAEALFLDLPAQFVGRLEPALDRLPGTSLAMPPALDRIFRAPYRDGVSAVAAVVAAEGRGAIDALLADPPTSTEQLLHPEKLAAREPPLTLEPPDLDAALGVDWTRLGTDTLGEFQLRVYLDDALTIAAADAGADGWGGDRYALFQATDGDTLLAWRIQWDDAAEAGEFLSAYTEWLQWRVEAVAIGCDRVRKSAAFAAAVGGWGCALTEPGGPLTIIVASGNGRTSWIAAAGMETLLVIGTDPDDVDRAAAHLVGSGQIGA